MSLSLLGSPQAHNSSGILSIVGDMLCLRKCQSIKNNAEDHGRKPVGESVPAGGWKLLKDEIL